MTSIASAFARANLIGEHTDYNEGFVLPTPLPFETEVQIEKIRPEKKSVFMVSEQLNETRECALDAKPSGEWTDYIMACLYVLREQHNIETPPIRIRISSNIPMGAGISSSAALMVATLRGLRGLIGFAANDRDIAIMANRAEREYVGVPCGMMDQFVCALGRPGHAFMFDTKHLTYEQVRLPKGYEVMLVHCGSNHRLASGDGYRVRVAECKQIRDDLGIASLRDLRIKDLDRLNGLPDHLRRRAKHIITENQRVLDAAEALRESDVDRLADLMAASHDSQRDDYEVSVPEIDALVVSSREFGVKAARLTGGGFGGSIVAIVPQGQTTAWWAAIKKDNPNSNLITTTIVNKP